MMEKIEFTFLPLMEDWRTGMILTFPLLWVRKHLAAGLVNAFLGHLELTVVVVEKDLIVDLSGCDPKSSSLVNEAC